ncbi:MAG: DEAD/DEAH box helicase [Hyphomicrobiales bacterium]|nr:DEAD/DEAH box helicase [Hyphomicrobiales bacterium]
MTEAMRIPDDAEWIASGAAAGNSRRSYDAAIEALRARHVADNLAAGLNGAKFAPEIVTADHSAAPVVTNPASVTNAGEVFRGAAKNPEAEYAALLAKKRVAFTPRGLTRIPALNAQLKPHQAACVEFALTAGCSGAFLDTGLGKSFLALEWGRVIVEETGLPVLMLAPLAVSRQHEREAARFGIDAKAVRDGAEVKRAEPRVYITNYERLDKFNPEAFGGVILDESSILKSFTGATTRALIAAFAKTPYRLACTATPAPNDHMELGQHSAFLGVMEAPEMLSRWFITDRTQMGKYRLKRPAVKPFWQWVASWARCVAKPSDLGFDDAGYDLPPLMVREHVVAADLSVCAGVEKDGQLRLFRLPETSATSIHREKRMSADARADVIAGLVAAEPGEAWIVWCDTDYEADALAARIPGAFEVRGSMPADAKEERLVAFSEGQARVLITKPSIAGYGLNWQHCARVAFAGLSFSYESYYQAVRRCWRFGQARPVHVHIAMADTERAIFEAINRKAADHEAMKREMTAAMRAAQNPRGVLDAYRPTKRVQLPEWMR